MRAAAWSIVGLGLAAPAVRRRLRLKPPVVLGAAASAPVALCVALPRSRGRDVAVSALQMWAYVAAYELPNDDPQRLRARVRMRYPVLADRVIGLGELPGLRLQRALGRPGRPLRAAEQVLVWCHWLWFLVPHGAVAWLLVRRRELFPSAAAIVYATFDLGVVFYWIVPTAPPWYAAQVGALGDGAVVRRMMLEHGEAFWGGAWTRLYDVLAGNPLAAMPSLHFATSVAAARQLARAGRGPGALGWAYAATLGVALVYLGEHYVIDLVAGFALTEAVRRAAPRVAPAAARASGAVQALERRAQA
jgi:membrane-associated phospholipid phosphatase